MGLIPGRIIPDNLLKRRSTSYLFALLTVIVLPIHVQYLPPLMILWGIFWILENYLRFSMIWDTKKSYRVLFILFISYYIWQAAGLIYTSDIKMGLSNLFGRLSLILFPLVLIFPGEIIKSRAKNLIRVFAVCTFLFMLFCFSYALYQSVNLKNGLWTFNPHPSDFSWLSYFYSSNLTISQHPTYIAMYVLFSVFICIESWFDYSLKFKYRVLWLILALLLIISQYFLSSRAGILISLILVPLYFIIKFREFGKKRFAWLWIILVIIILLPFIIKNQRVDYLYGRLFHKQIGYERKRDPRFLIWKSAFEIARKNVLLGVGIGDVRTVLILEYKRIGEEQMAIERFNAHNQFLEVLLENGIIGLGFFISMFICMFYIVLSDKNLLYGLFIMILFMFFMFETVLYRLAGVSFFSLFSFLLIYINKPEQSNHPS
ncbi:MAG: O-antigen ligase family protein [Bacteroidales bacterium]